AIPLGTSLFAVKSNGGGSTYLNVTAAGTSVNNGLSATGTISFGSLSSANGGVAVLSSTGVLSRASIDLGALPTYISGTLKVGNGGTGASSFSNTNGVIY